MTHDTASAAPTLEAVAALAGVSRATVSRVVNDSPRVKDGARTAVLAAIEQLGYVPAYAVAAAGAPVDVEPKERRRAGVSITAAQDPTQVSRSEFDDMVRNLGVDEASARKPAAAAAVASGWFQ